MVERGFDIMSEERVLIIAIKRQKDTDAYLQSTLDELVSLSDTAGGKVVSVMTQARDRIHPATYLGDGKIDEIKAAIEELEIDLVISNGELSAGQLRNLTNRLEIRIIDRSQLILDIFAQRAQTKEGKLQVELAQLQYMLPRLHGQGVAMSRLGGGIGTRGPGETKLETDQRHIRRRIDDIRRRLKLVVQQREQYRKRRKHNEVFQIAVVGYTNAGKSTIFNRLTNGDTLEMDKLFATLDPLTRQVDLPSGFKALITDTVGFIQDLPTALIASFRSTLEEVSQADFILHVVDASHEDYQQHEKTVLALLHDLEADAIPTLTVYNKKDIAKNDIFPVISPSLYISAYKEADIQKLIQTIETMLTDEWDQYRLTLDGTQGKYLQRLEQETIVTEKEFDETNGTYIYHGFMRKGHPLNSLLKGHKKDND